jgi:UMP-CMP kinase
LATCSPTSHHRLAAATTTTTTTTTTTAANMADSADAPPVFSPADVSVVFVLGGPGAGKGTQCANLVLEMGFNHLSAGDLLREEQAREGSEFGELIKEYIREGKIVPLEVTVKLLENAMKAVLADKKTTKGRFLIDGFPRKLDQAHAFEKQVCPAKMVLFYDCPEDELESRLLNRGKTSGRADDNIESIKKRFRTFVETSMPVVDYYEAKGQVARINANQAVTDVFRDTIVQMTERLGAEAAA